MEIGDVVLIHLSPKDVEMIQGNKKNLFPAIVVNFNENEFPTHPVNPTGINVRVFTDDRMNPIWLNSVPMIFDGINETCYQLK